MSDIDTNKLRRLDGGLLLVFRELLRTGRASVVAERLGLSQPAISHALTRLRDLFEDPLFIRRPHGLEPTGRALELGPRIEALVSLADQAMKADGGFDPTTSDRLFRFAAPEFVTALMGGELINRLKVVAPGVSFAIDHLGEDEVYRPMRLGDGEFAIGRFRSARSGYVLEPFMEDVWCTVARRGHPEISGPLSWDDWRRMGHVFAWSPSETGQPPGRAPEMAMRAAVPHWLTALLLVASTDAIATVPRKLAERHSATLGLQLVDVTFTMDRFWVSVLRREGVVDPGADWFLAQVRAAVEASA